MSWGFTIPQEAAEQLACHGFSPVWKLGVLKGSPPSRPFLVPGTILMLSGSCSSLPLPFLEMARAGVLLMLPAPPESATPGTSNCTAGPLLEEAHPGCLQDFHHG